MKRKKNSPVYAILVVCLPVYSLLQASPSPWSCLYNPTQPCLVPPSKTRPSKCLFPAFPSHTCLLHPLRFNSIPISGLKSASISLSSLGLCFFHPLFAPYPPHGVLCVLTSSFPSPACVMCVMAVHGLSPPPHRQTNDQTPSLFSLRQRSHSLLLLDTGPLLYPPLLNYRWMPAPLIILHYLGNKIEFVCHFG